MKRKHQRPPVPAFPGLPEPINRLYEAFCKDQIGFSWLEYFGAFASEQEPGDQEIYAFPKERLEHMQAMWNSYEEHPYWQEDKILRELRHAKTQPVHGFGLAYDPEGPMRTEIHPGMSRLESIALQFATALLPVPLGYSPEYILNQAFDLAEAFILESNKRTY